MSFFVQKNMNPWGSDIGDCAIRAVSAALGMKYEAVCRFFGKKCRPGTGLVGVEGIGLEHIKRSLDPFFDRIEDAKDTRWENRPEEFKDMEFDPAFDGNPDLGLTLDEFCEAYKDTGRFLVALRVPGKRLGHIVYADLREGKNHFYDTWDCGEMVVRAYMRVKAILDPKDPRSLFHKKGT